MDACDTHCASAEVDVVLRGFAKRDIKGKHQFARGAVGDRSSLVNFTA